MTHKRDDRAVLEVVVLHARDAAAATEGGADRLLVLSEPNEPTGVLGGRMAAAATVSSVIRETDLPVRVLVRAGGDTDTDGAELNGAFTRAGKALQLGAEGICFGFLDRDLRVDVDACAQFIDDLARGSAGSPGWTFRGIDESLDLDHAWSDVRRLPRLDAVATAGSSRGLAAGAGDLVRRAGSSPDCARLILACGDAPDQVPWLVRAGVRQFGIGVAARAGESWSRGYVDAGAVRTWRMLIDDALARAHGTPVE